MSQQQTKQSRDEMISEMKVCYKNRYSVPNIESPLNHFGKKKAKINLENVPISDVS